MPQGRSHEDDLKAREYRDKDGNIHHHTHPYMERHGQDGGAKSAGSTSSGARSGSDRKASSSRSSKSDGEARTTTDHEEIRTWAERHGGRPAAVRSTHRPGDVGIIRIMFPHAPNADDGALTEITWDEFFQEFEGRDLALLHEPRSNFNKIIGRDTARKRARGDNKAAR